MRLHANKGKMSSCGEGTPELERQRILDDVDIFGGVAVLVQEPGAQSDRKIVLAAVTQDGTALQHAAAELWDDREIVLSAVAQNGVMMPSTVARSEASGAITRSKGTKSRSGLRSQIPRCQTGRRSAMAIMQLA